MPLDPNYLPGPGDECSACESANGGTGCTDCDCDCHLPTCGKCYEPMEETERAALCQEHWMLFCSDDCYRAHVLLWHATLGYG